MMPVKPYSFGRGLRQPLAFLGVLSSKLMDAI
jgi:hypothetical protein